VTRSAPPHSRLRYIVDRREGERWIEAGDYVTATPGEAVRLAAGARSRPDGVYRARPEGSAPGSAALFRVQLSGRPVAIDVL
jgi:hypothetical protein